VRRVARRDVVGAFDDPETGATVLHLTNGARLELGLNDKTARETVLHHLGQTLDQRALTALLRGTIGPFTRGLLAFAAFTIAFPVLLAFVPLSRTALHSATLLSPVIAAALTTFFVRRWGSPKVIVGMDGLRLVGRLRPRFVPFSKIVAVEEMKPRPDGLRGIELRLEDGEVLLLPTVAQSTGQIAALRERIQEGRRRYAATTRPPLENFERAGRPVKDWRAELTRRVQGGGFREATIDPHDLEQLVGDPSASIDRRVGAALALRVAAPDAVARVRVAAARAADEHVRIALEEASAVDLDDARLEQALARMSR
jgi:hypothetical protein